ncbi:uncharacterized protein LOC141605320 [Silene latifolia]|uniref:uncharacterized protein LOC141605320 n=1 Tax=Silene latifolia TaxID=37657 RepID=UPI003D7718B0
MALFYCFGMNKKKTKVDVKPLPDVEKNNVMRTFEVKLENPVKASEQPNSLSLPVLFNFPENSKCKVKLLSPNISAEKESFEVAYEGEDERDDKSPISRDNSDCNLQAQDIDSFGSAVNVESKTKYGEATDERVTDFAMVQCGHVSDPGMAREERWAPPQLTRSCSALDTRELAEKVKGADVFKGSPCRSQSSVLTHRSADKVMLKKHSSSQILPSRSRKLWWKLFLWSHRNLQKPLNADKTRVSHLVSLNQQGGYSSDPLEPSRVHQLRKQESAGSSSEICSYKSRDKDNTDGFEGRVSGLWPQNQWVAFSRVEDWVKDIDIQPDAPSFEEQKDEEHIEFPPSPEASCSFLKDATHVSRYNKINLSEELLYANSVVQSLNSSSTVAHISGLGLKAIPMIAQFSSLRTVNLSNNSIVQITSGSLPRGLHVLDLSKNRINSIDGLRELTRLRIVDLSYNKISRLGHGLSNCSLLKELYLAGNKISEVEGLHRLLKLTVLDISFNKITTTKALGQLVANYHSLLGLNLLGNPIQGNLGEDQLRRAVCGLLPKLAYLNKQPVNQQKARDLSIDIVNKASSRSSSYGARRKVIKRGAQSGAPAKSSASVGPRTRKSLKSRGNKQSSLKTRA